MLLPPLGQILLGADDGHVGNQHLWRLEDGDEIKVLVLMLVLGPGATESGLLESVPWVAPLVVDQQLFYSPPTPPPTSRGGLLPPSGPESLGLVDILGRGHPMVPSWLVLHRTTPYTMGWQIV